MTATVFRQSYVTQRPSLFTLISYCAIVFSFALMVGLLHAMAFMVLLLIDWVIWNNKPLPLPFVYNSLLTEYYEWPDPKLHLTNGFLLMTEGMVCNISGKVAVELWWVRPARNQGETGPFPPGAQPGGAFEAFAPPKFSKHCRAILTFVEIFKE